MLLAIGALLFSTLAGYAGGKVALVIGNSQYIYEPRLENPANDEADVANALRDIGFRVIEGKDLDKAGLDTRLHEFIDAADGADVALMFYAGHGMQVDGRDYLIPTDAKLERRSALDFEVVDVERLASQIESVAKASLVFLDACRDNPLASNFAGTLGRSGAVGRGLAPPLTTGVGTFIALSTAPGKVARDGAGRNSPFTAALLHHIRTPGLEIKALMTRVRAEVALSTREEQIPWVTESLRTDVYLLPSAPAETATQQSACEQLVDEHADKDAILAKDLDAGLQACANAIVEHPQDTRLSHLLEVAQEERAFQRSLRSRDRAISEAYLVLYPAGLFIEDVKQHLASLEPSPTPSPMPSHPPDPIKPEKPKVDAREVARMLQIELKRVGCDPISLDGNWDASSERALSMFNERTHGSFDVKAASLEAVEGVRARSDLICRPTTAAPAVIPARGKPPAGGSMSTSKNPGPSLPVPIRPPATRPAPRPSPAASPERRYVEEERPRPHIREKKHGNNCFQFQAAAFCN